MMAAPARGTEPDRGREGRWKRRLSNLIQDWERTRQRIENILDDPTGRVTQAARLDELTDERRHLVNQIRDIAEARNLNDFAVEQGFRADLLETPPDVKSGQDTGNILADTKPRDSNDKNVLASAVERTSDLVKKQPSGGGGVGIRERLKNFKLVRLPSGRVVAVRTINIRGNKVQWGVHVDKADFDKYGIDERDIGSVTKAQAKKIEVMGNASELVFRGDDKSEFKAIVRGITRAHKGSPILEDDEVLGIIVAQSALGLNDNETQGLLKKTKWYKRSTDHEQLWTLDYSPEKRREDVKNLKVRLVDELEDLYGMDWTKHVKGGMKQVGKWAEQIASGELGGDPSAGLDRWLRNQFDNAAEIQGTPAWMQQQSEAEEAARFVNRPEDMFEQLRAQAMNYLGYDRNDTPRIDRDTLQKWAGQLVTGEKSEGDWAQYLRDQMKVLHPYFDPNLSFIDQATSYKSIAERIMGDTLDWSDRLLLDFTRTKPDGTPTDRPMSLHDFELKVRQDPRAWKQGTQLFEEGLGIVQALEATFKGVG